MKHLYLLRHAKSSWELGGQLDYERGLTERGESDCELIAGVMKQRGIAPDVVVCSGARRTRETLEGVAGALSKKTPVEFTDDLYRADVSDFLGVLQNIDADAGSALVIGHNPSIHDTAVEVASGGEELERMAAKFPTCAIAELTFKGKWSKLGADDAELIAFVTPKQLRKGEKETI